MGYFIFGSLTTVVIALWVDHKMTQELFGKFIDKVRNLINNIGSK